jgi:hypothetical protein
MEEIFDEDSKDHRETHTLRIDKIIESEKTLVDLINQ